MGQCNFILRNKKYVCTNVGCGFTISVKGVVLPIRRNCLSTSSSAKQISSYLTERAIWRKSGKKLRSPEKILEIYETHCKPCDYFQPSEDETHGRCGLCGCHLRPEGAVLNKIAWATTKCPDKPSKWGPEDNA